MLYTQIDLFLIWLHVFNHKQVQVWHTIAV